MHSKLVSLSQQFLKSRCKLSFISCRNYLNTSLNLIKNNQIIKFQLQKVPSRFSSNNASKMMSIHTTRYTWRHFFDTLHFYVMLGVIPYFLIATYANVFIGPAELKEIPEGYEPRHWEYYEHPITRFLIRNIIPHIQKTYEKNLHAHYEEMEAGFITKDLKIYGEVEPLLDNFKTPYFIHVNPIGVNEAYDILKLEEEKGYRSAR